MIRLLAIATACVLGMAGPVAAQTNVDLGGLTVDTTAPVEVTADSLSIDQDTGRAVFDGNVVIGQGALRVTAGRVEVVYGDDTSEISELIASGGVTFVTESEAAEAQEARYDITTGILILTGEVLLTQGASAIAANRMDINVTTGNATMEGRVRTVCNRVATDGQRRAAFSDGWHSGSADQEPAQKLPQAAGHPRRQHDPRQG